MVPLVYNELKLGIIPFTPPQNEPFKTSNLVQGHHVSTEARKVVFCSLTANEDQYVYFGADTDTDH